ncbi:energy transducer TonB, partial [Salinisphaera sp.]|uniref:energy transducer TonB n=1 Tax=Salinisphaera sp. TaxID=1914330 RepID=UPI002D788284
MKYLLFLLFVAFSGLSFSSHAGELRHGSVYATVKFDDAGTPYFEREPAGGLPDSILEKMKPLFLNKAKQVRATSSNAQTTYHMGIDWRLIQNGDKQQLKFEYKNSQAVPLVQTSPEFYYQSRWYQPNIDFVLTFTIEPNGTVSNLSIAGVPARFHEIRKHVQREVARWRYQPAFLDGVAVESKGKMDYGITRAKDALETGGILNVSYLLKPNGQIDDIRFQRHAVPGCFDIEKVEEDIKAAIMNSDRIKATQNDLSASKWGHFVYRLPKCRLSAGDPSDFPGWHG